MMGKFYYHLIVILNSRSIRKFWMQIRGLLLQKISRKAFNICWQFLRELQINKKKTFRTTWPGRSLDLNVTENVCLAVKLKLHIENRCDQNPSCGTLVTAACRFRRSLFIEYIQNLYASIPHKLRSVIAGKYFSTKNWRFEAILIRVCVEKYTFCSRRLP